MRAADVAAAHSTPIIGSSGRLWGVFTVHFCHPQPPDRYDPTPLIGLASSLPISWSGPTSARRAVQEYIRYRSIQRQNRLTRTRSFMISGFHNVGCAPSTAACASLDRRHWSSRRSFAFNPNRRASDDHHCVSSYNRHMCNWSYDLWLTFALATSTQQVSNLKNYKCQRQAHPRAFADCIAARFIALTPSKVADHAMGRSA